MVLLALHGVRRMGKQTYVGKDPKSKKSPASKRNSKVIIKSLDKADQNYIFFVSFVVLPCQTNNKKIKPGYGVLAVK